MPNYRKEQVTFRLEELEILDKINLKVVDLTNKNEVKDLIKEQKPRYLAHLGSQSSVKKSFKYKKLTEESNLKITENLVNAIENYSKDTVFFFPSSATIYEGYKNVQVNELTKPLPKTEYAKSKLISEFISKLKKRICN